MYLIIHRGTGQIGGNIIEVDTERTRLIFDAGANLPPLDDPKAIDPVEIDGLTCGEPAFDAVFISHHHNDHSGLIRRILPSVPVWAGRDTARILEVISDFTGGPEGRVQNFFEGGGNCQPNHIGDITVTPIGVDHSAYDAYMFLIQADGKNVLYTGDYRAAEEVPEEVQRLIGVAGMLDVLITEGTNIRSSGREKDAPPSALRDETVVEEEAVKVMENAAGTVFVLCSSTNEPRIRAIDAACKRAGRTPCHDVFMTAVRGPLAERDECRHQSFVAGGVDQEKSPRIHRHFARYFEQRKLVGAASLARFKKPQTIFVRTSMLEFMGNYLDKRGGSGHVLIYSMWEGYRETGPVQQLLKFCEEMEINVVSLHCSGHAYRNAIKGLIWRLGPKSLIPIHCDSNARALFEQMHDNCILLQDGEQMDL